MKKINARCKEYNKAGNVPSITSEPLANVTICSKTVPGNKTLLIIDYLYYKGGCGSRVRETKRGERGGGVPEADGNKMDGQGTGGGIPRGNSGASTTGEQNASGNNSPAGYHTEIR